MASPGGSSGYGSPRASPGGSSGYGSPRASPGGSSGYGSPRAMEDAWFGGETLSAAATAQAESPLAAELWGTSWQDSEEPLSSWTDEHGSMSDGSMSDSTDSGTFFNGGSFPFGYDDFDDFSSTASSYNDHEEEPLCLDSIGGGGDDYPADDDLHSSVSSEYGSETSDSESEHRSDSSSESEGYSNSSGMGSEISTVLPRPVAAASTATTQLLRSALKRKLTWDECAYALSPFRFFITIQVFCPVAKCNSPADMALMVDDTDKLKPRPLMIHDTAVEYIFRESGSKLSRRKAGSDRWVNSGGVAGATIEPGLQRLRCRYGRVSIGGAGSSQNKMPFVRQPPSATPSELPASQQRGPIQSFWLPRFVG